MYAVFHRKDDPLKIRITSTILIFLPLLFAFFTGFTSALPNGTETPLTTSPTCAYLSAPAIYGDKIVWEDVRNSAMNQIYIYDLASGREYPLNSSPDFQYQPAIYGDTAVWTEPDFLGSDSKIVTYDTASLSRIEYNAYYDSWNSEYNFPKISGDTIVWQDYNGTTSNWDISVVRNSSSLPELILYGDGDQKHPEIYQNYIVYENWTGIAYNSPSDIWLFNLSNDTAVPVSDVFYQETFPHIYGERIVWEATNLSGDGIHIYIFENGMTTRLSPVDAQFDQVHPSIFGNTVAVEDKRRAAMPDVYLYDLLNGTETWVAPNDLSGSQMNPDVYDSRIVWTDSQAGQSDQDIYLFTLGPVVECPIAGFSSTPSAGPTGLSVTFTDTSRGSSVLHRTWNFSDGSPWSINPVDPVTHQFVSAGIYPVKLTVGNTFCRNSTPDVCRYRIYVDAPPEADFSATPVYGFAPLAVHFTDTSCGAPESRVWDFGDGTTSTEQNPVHVYTQPGSSFSVSLTVNNTQGGGAADTRTQTDYIRTLIGATEISITPVDGITTDQRYGIPFLIYNGSLLNSYTTDGNWSFLTSIPPAGYGWQNISFISSDASGFQELPNQTITGNFSSVYLHTKDLTATNATHQIGVNYQVMTTDYPAQSAITSEIWEGALPADAAAFEYFASLLPPTGYTTISSIPFTAHVTQNPLFGQGTAFINVSIGSSWYDSLQETPTTPVVIIGIGYDSAGNTVGIGLRPARHRAGDVDFFTAEAPLYLTKFGLTQMSGSGNPFQLVTLTIVSIISPEGDRGGSGDIIYTPGDVPKTQTPEIKPTSLPETGKTARLYTNSNGIITQATTLLAADGFGSVFIRKGIVVKNSTGGVPSSITISSLPADTLPGIPDGSGFSYAGLAYDLQPDGCTFSPAISLNFTIPQARHGQEFMVKTYDETTITWLEVPATYHPDNGIVTAELFHFCPVALFARAVIPAPHDAAADMPTQIPATPDAPPAPTAFSTFSSMILWVIDSAIKNMVITAGLVILAVAVFLYGRKQRGGRIMYLL